MKPHSSSNWIGFGKVVTETINRHGHAFQHAVLRMLETSEHLKTNGWEFTCSELPVQNAEAETKIDAILTNKQLRIIVVIECKRVATTRFRWVFFTSPQMSRRNGGGLLHFVELAPNQDSLIASKPGTWVRDDLASKIAHLGIQVVNNQSTGEDDSTAKASSRGNQSIEDACGQVLLGSGGLQEAWLRQKTVGYTNWKSWIFFPIVITNTELYRATADLASADLSTGNLAISDSDLKQTDSIILQYPASISLTQSKSMPFSPEALSEYKELQLMRSVLICQPAFFDKSFADMKWVELRKAIETSGRS